MSEFHVFKDRIEILIKIGQCVSILYCIVVCILPLGLANQLSVYAPNLCLKCSNTGIISVCLLFK